MKNLKNEKLSGTLLVSVTFFFYVFVFNVVNCVSYYMEISCQFSFDKSRITEIRRKVINRASSALIAVAIRRQTIVALGELVSYTTCKLSSSS